MHRVPTTVGLLLGTLLGLGGGCASAPSSHDSKSKALSRELTSALAPYSDGDVSLAYKDLGPSGTLFERAPGELFHAASTMKVAVLYELYRQVDRGSLSLDQQVPIRLTFKSIVDGSPFSLSAASDSEHSLYRRVGSTASVKELARLMITWSSNLATNLLIELVDARSVQAALTSLGLEHMRVLRGVEDLLAFEAGLNNVTTAHDLMLLMEAVAEGRGLSETSHGAILNILEAQAFNELIPAGLPPGTPVAHKTGSITKIQHDAAIVRPRTGSPYVLVVLTRGFSSDRSAAAVVEVSRRVFAAHMSSSPSDS